jgi:multiple sugar transport system permease protein
MSAHSASWRSLKQRAQSVRALLLALVVIVLIAPLVWTLLASFNIQPDDSSTPPTWSWRPSLENYGEIGVVTPVFVDALASSITISTVATALTITVALLAAYGLARSIFRGVHLTVSSFLVLASIPVMAFAIPLAVVIRAVRLYDSFLGVMLAQSAFFAPLAVYVLYGYILQVSIELEEAARLDGANVWHILRHVVLPEISSGIAATAIILFVLNWNMLLIPLVLGENRIKTIPTIMSGFFVLEREMSWSSASAVIIISLVPLLILIISAHHLLERFHLTPLTR